MTANADNVNEALFGYANRFSAFLASTNQKVNITKHMTAIFNALGDLLPSGKRIFMDIACGEGELTVPVYETLLQHNSDVALVGIDPSSTMTDALNVRLNERGLQGSVITDKFFDHSSEKIPESIISIGKGDIVLCSHGIYYAVEHGVDVATDQILNAVAEDGILVSVHQSKKSQMHVLRNKFSTASVRCPDGEPITADHMEARLAKNLSLSSVAQCDYTSDLYFEEDTVDFITDFITVLRDTDQGVDGFQELIDKYGKIAVNGRNVLEFILREDLFAAENDRAIRFLEEASKMLQENERGENGKPRIIISESISFVSPSQEVQGELSKFASTYQSQIPTNAI